jgi:hypothetical protein
LTVAEMSLKLVGVVCDLTLLMIVVWTGDSHGLVVVFIVCHAHFVVRL